MHTVDYMVVTTYMRPGGFGTCITRSLSGCVCRGERERERERDRECVCVREREALIDSKSFMENDSM